MRRIFAPLILFLLIVLEGVSQELLPEMIVSSQTLIISHWVFIFLVLVAIFLDDENSFYAIIFAIIFGLLKDIVYTEFLGIYMIAYTITIFIVHQFIKIFQANFFMTLIFTMIGLFIVDNIIYLMYIAVGHITLPWSDYSLYRLLPTILANIIFLIIIYPIFKNRLSSWSGKE
ncbi:MAG TPA: rod shape-determining protein MreD [Bacillota bacterium]|nr:rod shape-determining protein MreD [Bacillota bacterium]